MVPLPPSLTELGVLDHRSHVPVAAALAELPQRHSQQHKDSEQGEPNKPCGCHDCESVHPVHQRSSPFFLPLFTLLATNQQWKKPSSDVRSGVGHADQVVFY